jgi:hypothetical protein
MFHRSVTISNTFVFLRLLIIFSKLQYTVINRFQWLISAEGYVTLNSHIIMPTKSVSKISVLWVWGRLWRGLYPCSYLLFFSCRCHSTDTRYIISTADIPSYNNTIKLRNFPLAPLSPNNASAKFYASIFSTFLLGFRKLHAVTFQKHNTT